MIISLSFFDSFIKLKDFPGTAKEVLIKGISAKGLWLSRKGFVIVNMI